MKTGQKDGEKDHAHRLVSILHRSAAGFTSFQPSAWAESEAPPKETTDKRPCEAGRCKGICQGLSSVTAYFYFFIATFALRQWAVQILHR